MIFLYIEGSGKLTSDFQYLFRQFPGVRVRMGEGNEQTERDWRRERSRNSTDHHFLLIDSEGPLTTVPENDQFFMVQMMESWFLADLGALGAYYGKGFNANAVPKRPIEEVSKKELIDSLNRAAKDTAKERYVKPKHSKELLRCIRLEAVRPKAPNCDRLVRHLEALK